MTLFRCDRQVKQLEIDSVEAEWEKTSHRESSRERKTEQFFYKNEKKKERKKKRMSKPERKAKLTTHYFCKFLKTTIQKFAL